MKRKASATSFPFININAFAKLVKFIGSAPLIITEIVKMNTNVKPFENHDPVHHINSATIIGRPGSIKTYYVKMMIQAYQISYYRTELVFFLRFASLAQHGLSCNVFAIYYIKSRRSIAN